MDKELSNYFTCFLYIKKFFYYRGVILFIEFSLPMNSSFISFDFLFLSVGRAVRSYRLVDELFSQLFSVSRNYFVSWGAFVYLSFIFCFSEYSITWP